MRAVTITSPEPLLAGTKATWECRIVLRGAPVTAGGCVKIACDMRGESGYHNYPQAENPAADNYVTVGGPEGVALAVSGYLSAHASHRAETLEERIESESYLWRDLLGITSSLNLHVAQITVAGGELRAGDLLVVRYGDTSGGSAGMQVPGQAKATWLHWACVQRSEGAELELLGGDHLVIRPSRPVRLNVVAPSVVSPHEEVAVAHVALDELGNVITRARAQFPPADTDEIATPAGGTLAVDRVVVCDDRVGLEGESNPIEIIESPEYRLFWGEIHGHTVVSDGGARTPDEYYCHGRDTALLDFCAIADHDFGIALYDPEKYWSMITEAARRFNEPGRFVTIPGWEISHAGLVEGESYGHKNVYFLDDEPPFFSSSPYGKWRAGRDHTHIEELVERLEASGATFMIVDHTSHMLTDWDRFIEGHTRLVEVYSLFGGSEAMDSPYPVGRPVPERTARAGLDRGLRVGFTAGTDTHMGAPAAYRETSFGRGRLPGLTAVWAEELSRRAIWDALYHRRTYATRAERILLRVEVNGHMMGEEFTLQWPDEPRIITVNMAGTEAVDTVEVIHNGEILHLWRGQGRRDLHLEYNHDTPMRGLDADPTAGYYYVRVIQDGQGVAWSSPTWALLT